MSPTQSREMEDNQACSTASSRLLKTYTASLTEPFLDEQDRSAPPFADQASLDFGAIVVLLASTCVAA